MTPPPDESQTLSLTETLDQRPSTFQIWWQILTGITTSWKELAKAHALISRLEAGELEQERIAAKALKKLEQAIIKMGETTKAPKTIRHELLAIMDKEYYQEVGKDERV